MLDSSQLAGEARDEEGYADAIVQTLRAPLLILDAELHVKSASPAFYRVFGITPAQTLGRPIYQLGNAPWDIPALRKLLGDILPQDGEFNDFSVEHHFPSLGKRTMLLNARRLRNADDETPLILLAIEDVTERRQAQRLLELSEVRYRRLFETAHDGILILDGKTAKVIDVNRFMTDLLSYPAEYFLGKELWQFGVFQDKAANVAAMDRLRNEGSVRYEDLPLRDSAGRPHPVEFVSNVYREDRRPVIQCNIRDISARKRYQAERESLLVSEQASRIEAEAANRSKDLFLATLSHEIRTPLNAIMGWASIIHDAKCGEQDLREGIEIIERNARAQAQLIGDLLDVSRIVSGKLRMDIGYCDISAVVRAAIDVMSSAAHAKEIRIDADLDPAASHASCDAIRIQQVVWNLLSNAFKFTPKGGTVRVILTRDRSATRIQVSDNGQGIRPEFLPYVFDRFRQADSGTRRQVGGLGLGLSIVKHLVELHGGTVEAHSDGEGCGSTFIVKLPIRAVLPSKMEDDSAGITAMPEALERHPARLDGLRLLIVEDESDARRALAKVLKGAGASVVAVDSAAEALESLSNSNPHVLISDIGMPVMDGFDLIREVRATRYNAKELPAIAVTGFAELEDQRRVLLAGFQSHVAKPVDPHVLIAVIASLAGCTDSA